MNKSVDHNHSSSETNSFESETTSSSKSSILSAGTVSPDHVTKQDDHDTHQLPQESFPWNQYICFLLINCAATAAVQFYQGIAKNALSVRSVPAIIFSQYAMQMFCNLTTPYWTSWLSHKTRIRISTFLFIFNFPLQSLVFQSNDHITLGCVMLNGMAAVITEITLLQYGSFYHKSCINAISTGSGIGGLIGASWALTITEKWLTPKVSILACLVCPATVVVTFFFILPAPPVTSTPKKVLEIEIEGCKPTRVSNARNNTFDGSEMNICTLMKFIFVDFWVYSIPLFGVYFGFEVTRSIFVSNVFSGVFYGRFNWVFRFASSFGKMSTNLCIIKKYCVYPIIVGGVAMVMSSFYFVPVMGQFVTFFQDQHIGQMLMFLMIAIPLGFAYGGTSANIYYAIRENVEDIKLREFALGNVRQAVTWGQILGNVLALITGS
eukprot:996307_1